MRGRSVEVLAIPSPWPAGATALRIISGYHGEATRQQAFTSVVARRITRPKKGPGNAGPPNVAKL
jgi:hypothetical protein